MNTEENLFQQSRVNGSATGVNELQAVIQGLQNLRLNKEKYPALDVTLPNYFWVAKRGGGISTSVKAFAEYLYATKIIEFTGKAKFFEFKLAYTAPDVFFSELTRLDTTISEIAGHHRYFKGLACINIDEWIQHTNEAYFHTFLAYLASLNGKILTIMYVHSDNKREVDSIASSLSSHIRFDLVWFKFPYAEELVDRMEREYFKQKGFSLTEDAKSLLLDSIREIIYGEHFNGFTTIRQLADDILFSMLTANVEDYEITADKLAGFNRDSAYIKRIKTFVGCKKKVVGFITQKEEHSNETGKF